MAPPVFPSLAGLTLPVKRAPIWGTISQVSIGGVVVTQQPQTYPRYRWTLDHAFLRQASAFGELQSLMGFYNRCGGAAQTFLYDDPQDIAVSSTSPQTIGIGDGVTNLFQLTRSRGNFIEPVFSPTVISSLTVAGVPPGAGYSQTATGGISINSGAPAVGSSVAWWGTYRWVCRFDEDSYDFNQFTAKADGQGPLWEQRGLSFTSVKFGA